MAITVEVLDEQQIEERAAILFGVDAQECQGCGRAAGPVADDAGWFIETTLGRPDASGEPIEEATILCPECW